MPKVTFQNDDIVVDVELEVDLKDVTKKNGWPVVYGCEDGVCGTCLIKVEDNEGLNEPTDVERQTLEIMGMDDGNYRLACQCKVKGDAVIEGM